MQNTKYINCNMRSEKYVYCKMQDVNENKVYKVQNNFYFVSFCLLQYNVIQYKYNILQIFV